MAWWNWLQPEVKASYVAAAGSIFVGFVAVFSEEIRRRWSRPRLTLECEPSASLNDVHVSQSRVVIGGRELEVPVLYVRARITNGGRTSATDVEALAVELWSLVDGKWLRDPDLLPMNLIWSYSGGGLLAHLPPGVSRHCDLFVVVPEEESWTSGLGGACAIERAALCLTPQHRGNIDRLARSGTYRLVISIAAKDVAAERFQVKFSVPSEWSYSHDAMVRVIAPVVTRSAAAQ